MFISGIRIACHSLQTGNKNTKSIGRSRGRMFKGIGIKKTGNRTQVTKNVLQNQWRTITTFCSVKVRSKSNKPHFDLFFLSFVNK